MPLDEATRAEFFKLAVDALEDEDRMLRSWIPTSIRTEYDATFSSVVHLPERIAAYVIMRHLRAQRFSLLAAIEQPYPNDGKRWADLVLATPGQPGWQACVEVKPLKATREVDAARRDIARLRTLREVQPSTSTMLLTLWRKNRPDTQRWLADLAVAAGAPHLETRAFQVVWRPGQPEVEVGATLFAV